MMAFDIILKSDNRYNIFESIPDISETQNRKLGVSVKYRLSLLDPPEKWINHRRRKRVLTIALVRKYIMKTVGQQIMILSWLILMAIPVLQISVLATEIQTGTNPANRLQKEQSPYLLMHANHPVNWYPWGEEAFEAARRENKPIFLSIGYSTCHWCHVMARESFADEEVAKVLNTSFISIKVDREERPDIDHLYMRATQMMTGRGGWPLTVILTPERKPFFAGTYFPKTVLWGRPGLMQLLPQLAEAWQFDRDKILANSDRITQILKEASATSPGKELGHDVFEKALTTLSELFDPINGGFGNVPKFPRAHTLTFLLRQYQLTGEAGNLKMASKTLSQMRLGGIYDHVGFGFHRYATDASWKIPHFEKMLYDQALLAMVYAEAYQLTSDPGYARTAREILTYLMRDMRSTEGGFFSAEDADSESQEGKYYLWTLEELQSTLGQANALLAQRLYHLSSEGNFTSPQRDDTGTNILALPKPLKQLASELGLSMPDLQVRLETIRKKLLAARHQRIRPLKDDKILTDWNGLTIAAFAAAGNAFGDTRYVRTAEAAADFVLSRLRNKDGRLLKRYRKGQAGLTAHLDDYAFTVWGLIELYQAGYKTRYLEAALELNQLMLTHFWDPGGGGLFFTADDSEALLVRQKEIYDGAVPSGNSVAALNLIRLGLLTGRHEYLEKADAIVSAFSSHIASYPAGYTQLLVALDLARNPKNEIVIVGNPEHSDTQTMLAALRSAYLPRKVVLLRPADDKKATDVIRIAPYTKNMRAVNGMATAYVCEQFVCNLPTTSVSEMMASLKNG